MSEIIHFSVFIPIHHSFGFSDIFCMEGEPRDPKDLPGSAPEYAQQLKNATLFLHTCLLEKL